MKNILVAVSGMTPQIITETVWSLTQTRQIDLTEIHVITTLAGKKRVDEALFTEGSGYWGAFCNAYDIEPSSVKFDASTIHVIKDSDGQELDDLRTAEDNEMARDLIFGLVEGLTREPDTCLRGSLAGGRKSMGFLLGTAFSLFGRQQDALYHVLVTPDVAENHPDFFFIPANGEQILRDRQGNEFSTAEVRIELVELPFVSVREFVKFNTQNYRLLEQRTQNEIQTVRLEYERLQKVSGDAVGLVGKSVAMRQVKEKIRQVADTDRVGVLVLGETGTGKELVARAVHNLSARKDKLFIPVNCGAIPKDLVEAELFGAVKGAYSGQVDARYGAFRKANGGTIFLDEIGELSPEAQQSLLRVLQEQKVKPVGSEKEEDIDVRIIAATNRVFQEMIEEGLFREDLFQRLQRWPIEIPPLRARKEDIPELAEHFLSTFNKEHNKQVLGFSKEAMSVLKKYPWKGNVRELENLLERLVIRSYGAVRLRVEEVEALLEPSKGMEIDLEECIELPLDEGVAAFEKIRIMHALEVAQGVKIHAAKALGTSRPTLNERIDKFGLKNWVEGLRG